MKFTIVAVIGLAVVAGSEFAAGQDAPKGAPELKDLRAKVSYGIGLSLGRNMKSQSVEIDPDVLAQGIKDALSGAKPLLSDQQVQEAMQTFSQQLAAKKAQAGKAMGDKNKADGVAYLAENKGKKGVVTLPSGLQYQVLKEGNGPIPKATDTVSTHYTGTLIDGTEFDSSVKRGQPASFPVNGVIAGWTEALQKMKVGSKWKLFIPSALAYGESPPPGSPIGPNAVLLFDIELLGIGK